jgi:hypothetical protein
MIILYFILGIIAALLLIALISPATYLVEKSIVINKPVNEVYMKVADLKYYNKWNPWQQTDPTATANITGSADSIGHRYGWEGKKVGVGSLTLANRTTNQSIHFDLEFVKPWKSKADDDWTFTNENGNTKVVWRNSGGLPFPVARIMGPMIKKNLNHQFEVGLSNLKKMCEG